MGTGRPLPTTVVVPKEEKEEKEVWYRITKLNNHFQTQEKNREQQHNIYLIIQYSQFNKCQTHSTVVNSNDLKTCASWAQASNGPVTHDYPAMGNSIPEKPTLCH